MEKGKQLQRTFEYCPVKQGVRSVILAGEPWFVAKDVCEALGINKYRDFIASHLDEDERMSILMDTLGGKQSMVAVNESGLYNLIFQSRKPEARAFRKWVTAEVLPSIRRTGMYSTYNESRNMRVNGRPLPDRGEMISVLDAALSRGRMQDVADAIGSTYGAVKACKSRFKRGRRGISSMMLLIYGWCVEELNNNRRLYEKP